VAWARDPSYTQAARLLLVEIALASGIHLGAGRERVLQ
jgi:hypothetical protein